MCFIIVVVIVLPAKEGWRWTLKPQEIDCTHFEGKRGENGLSVVRASFIVVEEL